MSSLDTQMKAKLARIDQIKKSGGLTTSDINNMLSGLIPEYNSMVDQYNALLERKNKIVTISYEIDDYVKYGTIIPASDRAYLNSLGIDI